MWKKSSFRMVPRMSTGVVGGLRGVAMPQDLCAGSSYTCGSVVAGANTGHVAPECDPLHGRRRRRRLEGGNGRVGPTRRGSCGGLGPDPVPECSHGLTYQNQVGRSTGQSPSGESQRGRSAGQLVQG